MSELTKQTGILTPTNMGEAMQFAETMAVSAFCPKAFQGKPADIVVAVQWASEVGLAPLAAMQSMAVINGKPSLYGDGMMALIVGHPEYVSHKEWREGDEAFCTIVRMRFNEKVETTRSFSMAQAKRAGLLSKAPWRQYTERMLQMRARGFAARDSFPDALSGMVIKEEAEDYPTASDKPIDITDQVAEVLENPLDATFGANTPETDPQISPVSDDDAVPDNLGPENASASEDAIQDTSEKMRPWKLIEDGSKEDLDAEGYADAMLEIWHVIEADESMRFVDRRHEIGEHKKDNDDQIDRLKAAAPDVAEALGKEYKKILARLSAKAKEAGEVKKKEKVK